MIVTIDVAGDALRPATDLGFLLHKHPDRVQTFPTTQGTATVFYPVATGTRCRAVLRVDGAGARATTDAGERYVNTIPYAGSSRLVVALGKVFGDAIAGRSPRADAVDHRWPMTLTVAAVPLQSDVSPEELFGPLGWQVDVRRRPLTPSEWGNSGVATVTLRGEHTVRDALRHLSVLIPVIAGDKHYFVDDSEVDKLQRLGDGWLAAHPQRDDIVHGYLKRIRSLADEAIGRIAGADIVDEPAGTPRESLARKRLQVVVDLVVASGARSVLDIGCGEGRLLAALAEQAGIPRLAGVDVSIGELRRAQQRLERYRSVELWQSSLMYTDDRCRGFGTAVLMEVIEHIEPERLPMAMASVFGAMAPRTVVVTTPNREYNPVYGLTDTFRHPDHRFEFTRTEFADWATQITEAYRYGVTHHAIGDPVDGLGAPTQCVVFTRIDDGGA